MSTSELKKVIKEILTIEFKNLRCALGAKATSTSTPSITSTSTSGTTTGGLYKLRITNTGGSAGTVGGQAVAAGDVIEF